MFIRTKTFKNKDGSTRIYLQVVQNVREEGRVRQHLVANLGRLDKLQDWSKEWGPALVFRRVWEDLKMPDIIERLRSRTAIERDVDEAAFAMVLNRLVEPRSKLGVDRWVARVYRPEFEALELHHYYRALDFLALHKDEIELGLFDRVRSLFDLELDLVFWDSTSTYFEGRGAAGLTEFGFSKDKRPDRVQVVIGLLMTRDGFPVAHQVFPGNTADVETFRAALRDVRQRFRLGRVILVGDRGMVGRGVLSEIERAGLQYIAGVRLRRLRSADAVLARAGRYRVVSDNLHVKQVLHEGVRYVVCHNPEQAEHDRKAREEMLGALREKLRKGPKGLVGNRGYRRYLKVQGQAVTLDEEAIGREARYDGKYVLRTNTELPPAEVAQAYKALWQVEQAFRELKSGLDLRPVFHWTHSRIRGHIMVCFLAFVMETTLRRRLNGDQVAYPDVVGALRALQAVKVELDGEAYLARTELPAKAWTAFKATGLCPPKKLQVMPRANA